MSVVTHEKAPLNMWADRYPIGTLVKRSRDGVDSVHKVRSKPFFNTDGEVAFYLEGWRMPVPVVDFFLFT